MSAVSIQQSFVSPADYLAAEDLSETKNEYVDGCVFARAQSNLRHADIGTNILCALKPLLRGSKYRILGCDARIHLQHGKSERLYYPDVSVVCGPKNPDAQFEENPSVIFEVLSPSTARYDNGEKKDAYLRCESLQAYVIVHSERVEVTIYTRVGDGWDFIVYNELTDTLPLPFIECELPLAAIYEE